MVRKLAGGLARRKLGSLIGGLALICLAHTGSAGKQNAANIIGQIKDESGGALPGVTVTAKSPSLQVSELSATTDERGEYRLSPLPVGVYSVEYSLAGFTAVKREGVQLTIGFTARLDEGLKVAALQERC